MTITVKTQAIAAGAIIAAALTAMIAARMDFSRGVTTAPKPISKPFKAWGERWVTPPLPAGDYLISLEYSSKQGGRLAPPQLELGLFDQTAQKALPTNTGRLFDTRMTGINGNRHDGWEGEIVTSFHALEGHRYAIDIDEDQVNELARYDHRLTIDLTPAEYTNRLYGPRR